MINEQGPSPLDAVRVHTLAEVAAMTGMSHQAIVNDCRKGRLEHVHRGRLRGMTVAQIRSLIAAYTVGATRDVEMTGTDWAEAIAMTRRSGAARPSRRRTA